MTSEFLNHKLPTYADKTNVTAKPLLLEKLLKVACL